MRTLPRSAALAAALLASGALPNVARSQPARADTGTADRPVPPWERRSGVGLAVGGAGLYQSARGAPGARVRDGGGFDAFGSVAVSSFALGVGYQRTAHGLAGAGAGRVTEHGVYVEPRFSVAPFRNFTPYLSGRLGFIRRSAPAGAQYSAESASLVGYGAGVGTLVWVAPGVQLDVSAMYSRLSGDAGAGAPGAPRPFAGGTGGAAMLRAGLVLGFDRWGR